MTLEEQCSSCRSFDECARMYGRYMIYRAEGWREGWSAEGGPRPVCGCRWRVPVAGPFVMRPLPPPPPEHGEAEPDPPARPPRAGRPRLGAEEVARRLRAIRGTA